MSERILVAVSDAKSKELIVTALKNTNFSVHYAETTEKAADIFSSLTPDIIIADIQFTEWFLGQHGESNLPVPPIICYIKEYNARLAYELLKKGAYDCITDPLRPLELIGIVNKSLSKDILDFEGIKQPAFRDYISSLLLRNKRHFIVGGISAVLLISFLLYKITRPAPLKQFIEVPHINVTGVVVGEQTIFLSDWFTQSIYRYGRRRGELIDVYYFSDFGPLGIAADGNVIWSIGTDQKIRAHIIRTDGTKKLETIKTVATSIATPGGICIENKNLWATDTQSNKIWVYEISEPTRSGDLLKLKAEYTTGNLSPAGIWKSGKDIFIIDGLSSALLSGVISENRFIPQKEYSVKKPDEKVVAIGGIPQDSIFIVVLGDNSVVKRIPLKRLK